MPISGSRDEDAVAGRFDDREKSCDRGPSNGGITCNIPQRKVPP
jgi:hypothetical protein